VQQLRPFITHRQIADKVAELGQRISHDFRGESVVLIGVLKGAGFFLADLARQITVDATFDFISVSSYGDRTQHSGEVRLLKDVDQTLGDRNVILVEDIADTGLTLSYLKNLFLARHPRQLKIAALLDKSCRRIAPVSIDYVGFVIPDEFVVGYGMDLAERYRNLKDICVLESSSSAM